jgi:hypothetical protein
MAALISPNTGHTYEWTQTEWKLGSGYGVQISTALGRRCL